MKILHVIASINPNDGGPIEGVRQLNLPLLALGHKVDVVCLDASSAPWLNDSRLDHVIALGPAKFNYRYASKLVPWLRKHASDYDAVIVNGLWQYTGFAVWRVLANTTTPYFVFSHGMLDPWFKRTYPLKHFKKWLYWPWGEYRVLRDASAVIFTCEDERILAKQSFWLYRANEIVTSYGTSGPPVKGLELAQKFLNSYPELKGKRIALFLSRIHEKKGCDLLLEAFAQVACTDERLHLVMAGPDQTGWSTKLKAQAERLGLKERILWTGMLQGDAKWGAFYASEVFCLSSHQENFGIVVAEALACGKPVLISNKVNIWREIESDAAGFVDEDTTQGTVRNFQRWLALDSVAYVQMAERAKLCFSQRFHIQRAAERLVEIINQNSN